MQDFCEVNSLETPLETMTTIDTEGRAQDYGAKGTDEFGRVDHDQGPSEAGPAHPANNNLLHAQPTTVCEHQPFALR